MRYNTFPGTALAVSEVCLGTMTFGEQNSEADAHAQLDHAVAQGINFIDTAEMYPVPPNGTTQGRTEKFIGTWLERQDRAKLVVASKVAGPGRRDWIRNGRTDLTRGVIAEACGTSLERLRTDYLDVFQIHWPQRNCAMFGAYEFDPAKEREGPSIREQIEGMADLIGQGKIRHYGLSNETAWGVAEFHRVAKELGVPGPITTQNAYNLVSRAVDGDLAETFFRTHTRLLAHSPLGMGVLTGKYQAGALPEGTRFARWADFGVRFRKPIVFEAVAEYEKIARKHGLTMVELALGYVKSRWYVAATIVGATTLSQLGEDIAAAQVTLAPEVLADIAKVQERYPNPAN